jgi:2-hydroxy-3-keto-5-methylthiopentenyl-1-phosphate phosphatase
VIVLSDFDGTIAVGDITDEIWDRHVPDWQTRILPIPVAFEMIRAGYAEVTCPPDELLDIARAHAGLRDGFAAFATTLAARGWPLHVVSNGLRLYIEALLPARTPPIPVWAYDASFDGARWNVTLPAGVTPAPGEDFKEHVVRRLLAEARATSVYIGDGSLDLAPARLADHVFAVRDSALARLGPARGLRVREFDSFAELAAALDALAGGSAPHAG